MNTNARGQRLLAQSKSAATPRATTPTGIGFATLASDSSLVDTASSLSSLADSLFGSGGALFGASPSGRNGGWQFGTYSPTSYSSCINEPRDSDFECVSTTRSTGPGYERTSVYRSGSIGNGMGCLMQERVKNMHDTIQSAHERLTHTRDQLNHVQQRITLICADGNNLSERAAKSGADIATVQAQLVEMSKEMARMQDRFSAEINFVQEQLEKKVDANSNRIKRLEVNLACFQDL
jgi:hypothetical protein